MPAKAPEGQQRPCTCMGDGFAALPPEMRPRPQKKSSLRRVTCPGCGLAYWTNREIDLCVACEKRAATPRNEPGEREEVECVKCDVEQDAARPEETLARDGGCGKTHEETG